MQVSGCLAGGQDLDTFADQDTFHGLMLGPPNSRKRRSEGNCKNNSTQSLAPRILDNYRNRYKKNKLSKGVEEALIVSR